MLLKLFCSSTFDKVVYCLGEKQGMLVKDESSSYKVGHFLLLIWNRRKQILFLNGALVEVNQTNPAPECMINGSVCYGG